MAHPRSGNLGAKFSPKFPQLRPVLRKLGVVIFRQLFKTFNSNNFTLSLIMFSFQNTWLIKRKSERTLVLFHIFILFVVRIQSKTCLFFKTIYLIDDTQWIILLL